MDFRNLLESLDRLVEEEIEIKAERRVQDNGSLTTFNIDRNDPFKLFTGLRNGGENYSRDDVVKVYYKDEERLDLFYSNSDGRGAIEVDEEGTPVTSSQSNDELDADSRDSSTPATTTDEPEAEQNPNIVKLEDGGEFDKTDERSRTLAAQRADTLYQRYRELIGQMNEGAPISLRGYLKEHGLDSLLFEELSMADQRELQRIYRDLQTLISSGILSDANARMYGNALADAPQVAKDRAQTAAVGAEPVSTDDADSRDSGEQPETPPEAERASDASGDADATVEPGEAPAASNLEAFAKSGKGGLANDPDEVDAITELQQYLTDLGFDPNGVDGKYGPGTIRGVKAFQEWMGAKVDGDAGPETIGVIIKLRSIRWGEGGSKDFKAWRETMTRMEELIGKAGNNVDESLDKTSIRGILETLRRLDEALSDQELQDLKDIVDELRSAYEDVEFQQALPQRVQQRFSSNFQAAEGVLADNNVGVEDPAAGDAAQAADPDGDGNADDPEAQVFAGEQPAYKVVIGSGQGRRYTVYDAQGNELSNGRGPGPRLPTQQQWEAQNGGGEDDDGGATAPSGDAVSSTAEEINFQEVVDSYVARMTNEKLDQILAALNGPQGTRENAEYVIQIFTGEYGNDGVEGLPLAAQNTQGEKYTQVMTRAAELAGVPISDLGFEDSAAVSSNADDPEGGGSEVPTQTTVAEPTVTQQQVDTIAQMPIDNPQQITAFGQAIRDNAELYNMLTAEEKTAVDALIGGQ